MPTGEQMSTIHVIFQWSKNIFWVSLCLNVVLGIGSYFLKNTEYTSIIKIVDTLTMINFALTLLMFGVFVFTWGLDGYLQKKIYIPFWSPISSVTGWQEGRSAVINGIVYGSIGAFYTISLIAFLVFVLVKRFTE
ncbi:MAG: hypothetical protein V1848_04065 [Candidatus Magasanikbacteria bacterium]